MSHVNEIKTLTQMLSASIEREEVANHRVDDALQINDQLQDQIEGLLMWLNILRRHVMNTGVSEHEVRLLRQHFLDLEIAAAFDCSTATINEVPDDPNSGGWIVSGPKNREFPTPEPAKGYDAPPKPVPVEDDESDLPTGERVV